MVTGDDGAVVAVALRLAVRRACSHRARARRWPLHGWRLAARYTHTIPPILDAILCTWIMHAVSKIQISHFTSSFSCTRARPPRRAARRASGKIPKLLEQLVSSDLTASEFYAVPYA